MKARYVPTSSPIKSTEMQRASPPSDTLARLESRLSMQKTSPELQLGDLFIGDEGCNLLADFLKSNDSFSSVELRGNNITGQGILSLCDFIAHSKYLKHLSLEWNSIGLSDRGMEALSAAIIANKSLESVDLRNNRIGSNASVYIYDIVRQSSLHSLDLRWNDLGPQGAKGLVTALQANRSMTQLDLAGNKIGEDMLGLIEEILSKNRGTGEVHSARAEKEILKAMFSPSKTVPAFQSMEGVENIEPAEGSSKLRILDIKSRFDNELIERERTERKLNEAEQQLGQEREKNSQVREDLIKAVETEKARVKQAQEDMLHLKEEGVKLEMKYTKQVQDLEQKVTTLQSEKATLQIENDKFRESERKKDEYSKDKIQALEERCQRLEKDRVAAEQQWKEDQIQFSRDREEELKAVKAAATAKCRELEDKYLRVKADKEEAEGRVRELTVEVNTVAANKAREVLELEKKLRSEFALASAKMLKDFGARIKALESAREELSRRSVEELERLKSYEKGNVAALAKAEKDMAQLKDEVLGLQKENTALQAKVEQGKNEQQMNTGTMERFDANRRALSEEIQKIKTQDKAQTARLKGEHEKERKLFEQVKGQLNKRIADLEKLNTTLQKDIIEMKQQEERLCETLITNVKQVVSEKFTEHKQASY